MPAKQWKILANLGPIILSNVKGCLFEIGIGKSTHILKMLADEFKRDLYCFDKKDSCCTMAQDIGCKVFHGKSIDNFQRFPRIRVAMGLLDGRHEAATVRKELNFFLDLLSTHGVIFLHDTYLQSDEKMRDESDPRGAASDVYKVRQEMEQDKRVQTFTWPYSAGDCGLTMVMKLDPERPYYRK
ncbi:MAG TPA: class I SAM-dependent methyltransferase [bacterium]|nr:class I SAM-dependent methyltransferase [bacterium]